MHAVARCQMAPPEHPSWSTSHISEHRVSKHPQCDIFQWFHFVFKTCDKTAGTDQPWVGLTEGGGSALDVVGCPLKCCCLQRKTFPIPESTGQSPAQHCYAQTHVLVTVNVRWNMSVFVLLTLVYEFPTVRVNLSSIDNAHFTLFPFKTCSSIGPSTFCCLKHTHIAAEFSITSLAHQWILCSEWVPSEWESKQLIKTSQ